MDEPFGALDPIVRTQLQEQVAWLRDQVGTTILLVTHDVDEAFKLGDQIVVLETGAKIAQVGDARTLLNQSANQFVSDFIGRSQAARRLQVDEAGLVTDLLGVPGRQTSSQFTDQGAPMNWLIHNYAWVLELLGQHLVIAVSAIVVALVISIPLGRAAVNSAFGRGLVSVVGAMYALPSLALLFWCRSLLVPRCALASIW